MRSGLHNIPGVPFVKEMKKHETFYMMFPAIVNLKSHLHLNRNLPYASFITQMGKEPCKKYILYV